MKTIYTEQIQKQAASLLAPTDWMVVRKAEDSSKSIPSAVTTYRASVRTEADKIVKAKIFIMPKDARKSRVLEHELGHALG